MNELNFTDLSTFSSNINILDFVVNMLISALLSSFLAKYYSLYGHSLSNRESFSRNFVLLTITTMLIISIVKSSLALSLGLVGALSIVRFRTAIKEPEELSYLFLAIAIGLGMGADQRLITIVSFSLILLIITLKNRYTKTSYKYDQSLYLSLSGNADIDLDSVINILEKYCVTINLRRYDNGLNNFETTFLIEIESYSKLILLKNELTDSFDSVDISFMDNKGMI